MRWKVIDRIAFCCLSSLSRLYSRNFRPDVSSPFIPCGSESYFSQLRQPNATAIGIVHAKIGRLAHAEMTFERGLLECWNLQIFMDCGQSWHVLNTVSKQIFSCVLVLFKSLNTWHYFQIRLMSCMLFGLYWRVEECWQQNVRTVPK